MNIYLVLLNFAGAVTLRLWATRMVRTGMERSLGHAGRAGAVKHLARLHEDARRSIATGDIHLETIRALKTINSLLASLAYPVLRQAEERAGRICEIQAGNDGEVW